jgi:hypothetical protein
VAAFAFAIQFGASRSLNFVALLQSDLTLWGDRRGKHLRRALGNLRIEVDVCV